MKKLSIILALMAGFFFFACEEEEPGPILETKSSLKVTPLGEGDYEPVLADSIADSTFAVFRWQPAEYNQTVLQSYRVEIDTAENNFADAVVLLNTEEDSAAVNVFTFNAILTSTLGMPAGKECGVEVRIGSVVGESNPQITYSDPISMTVRTYEPPFEPDELFVHGTDDALGSLMPVPDGPEGQYEGYIYVPAGGDEIQFGDEAMEVMLGDADQAGADDDVDLNSSLAKNASAIPVDSGYYQVTVNTYDNSYDLYETTWGVIGSAIAPYDWTEDINMTYDPDNDIWSVVVEEVKEGEFKFRPNDIWDPLNYGDDGGDGIPEEYGANISIGAGTKKITLDLSEYPYYYSVEDAK